ncbi:MAG: hypothetical protein ACP5I9_10120, partial [Candidatus Kapaibacteriota bacterium]
MKALKNITGLVLFFVLTIGLHCEVNFLKGMEKKLISYKLVGAASSGRSILVWGNTEEVLRTTDFGKTWERKVILEENPIVWIEYIGSGKYRGFLKSNFGILSNDDGKTWSLVVLNESETILRGYWYQNNLFYMTPTKFKMLDQDFNFIKEFSYSTKADFYEFVVANNTIVFPSDSGQITLINTQNSQSTILDLKKANLCSNCPFPNHFLSEGIDFYFLLNNFFYRYNFSNNSFQTSQKYVGGLTSAFAIWKNNIYEIFSRISPLTPKDSLFFFKLTSGRKQINISNFDRRIINPVFTFIKFFNDSLIIAVGDNKLICLSNNGGKDWSVLSFVNMVVSPEQLFILDTLNLRLIDKYHNFYFSTNGGISWLPTKKYPDKLLFLGDLELKYQNFHYFFDSLNGLSVYRLEELSTDSHVVYTKDRGETLKLNLIPGFSRLNDNYQTLPLENKLLVFANNKMSGYGIWFLTWEVDSSFKFIRKSFMNYRQIFGPSLINNKIVAFSHSLPPKQVTGEYSYWIITSSDGGTTWDSVLLDFKSVVPNMGNFNSVDFSDSWAIDNKVYFYLSFLDQLDQVGKGLFCFDPETNLFSLVDPLTEPGYTPLKIFKIGNKTYYIKYYFTTVSANFKFYLLDNSNKLQELDISGEKFIPISFVRSNFNPDLFAVLLFNIDNQENNKIYLVKDNHLTKVEDEVEKRYYTTKFWASEPYPLPASVRVKSRVAWDGSFDLR